MEPNVLPAVVGGVYFPGDAHVDPGEFTVQVARLAERRGARVLPSTEVLDFETAGRRITAVATTRGTLHAEQVVLAAGAWSAGLARQLGVRLPIEAAKGYSITVPRPEGAPARPLLLSEAKVAVTPLGERLRLAGTLELAGLDLSINRRRVEAVRRAPERYLRCQTGGEPLEIWRGLRPCTPDGLPLLGRPRAWENLVVATGHAMKGICLGPVTGRLVAGLLGGGEPDFDLAPLHPDRFR
jgi:D-amino-acid dehydrogenase